MGKEEEVLTEKIRGATLTTGKEKFVSSKQCNFQTQIDVIIVTRCQT